MKAIDTNLLVYAQREELPDHDKAVKALHEMAEGPDPWAVAWPCLYEFVRVVTHPRVFDPPTPLEVAISAVESIVMSPSVIILGEKEKHLQWFRRVIGENRVTGNLVFDAHIAALMLEHGVDEIVTRDADFHRFAGIRVINPFE